MPGSFFSRLSGAHVEAELTAYIDGRLPAADARRVAEHLMACRACRQEHDEIRFGAALARQLPVVSAPDSLWQDIESELARRAQPTDIGAFSARASKPSARTFGVSRRRLAAAILLAAALGAGAATYAQYLPPSSWSVVRLAGSPLVDSTRLSGESRLHVGEWLETDSVSRARLAVGRIGSAEIGPGSRLRLIRSRFTDQRVALSQGSMTAVVTAPPRLFVVETPVATAIDLGCAYSLEVAENGESRLLVTAGWVALKHLGRESFVPAGMVAEMRRGAGPGTPYAEDASPALRRALASIDFGPPDPRTQRAAVDTALREATRRWESITLWHLLARVDSSDRERVYAQLAALVPPPERVTRDGALRLDERMLARWREHLDPMWSEDAMSFWDVAARRAWDWIVPAK